MRIKRTSNTIAVVSVMLLAVFLLCACGQKTGAEGTGNASGSGVSAEAGGDQTEGTQIAGTEADISLEEQLKLAWNFLTEGNYKEAVLAFTAVIDIDPKNGEAYRGRAGAYMGLAKEAGTGGSAEEYANYLALAQEDYGQAALYLPEQQGEQFNAQLGLCAGLLDSASAEYEAGDHGACMEQMRRASMTGGFNYIIWNPEYSSMREGLRDAVRGSGDLDLILAWAGALIDITEQSQLAEPEWTPENASYSLGQLKSMIVGQYSTSYLTTDTIEAIDRPIVDMVARHPEYQETGYGIDILYEGSIALGDFETAARMYPKMVEGHRFASNMDYVFGDGGYTLTYVTGGGKINAETEFDMYRRQLWEHYEHTDPAAVSDSRHEYEAGGPRRLRTTRVTTQASGTDGSETEYIYDNGRLSQERWHTWTNWSSNSYDYTWTCSYEYSGTSVTVTKENFSNDGETESFTKELVYSELR